MAYLKQNATGAFTSTILTPGINVPCQCDKAKGSSRTTDHKSGGGGDAERREEVIEPATGTCVTRGAIGPCEIRSNYPVPPVPGCEGVEAVS